MIVGMSPEVYLEAISYIDGEKTCRDIIVVDMRNAYCIEQDDKETCAETMVTSCDTGSSTLEVNELDEMERPYEEIIGLKPITHNLQATKCTKCGSHLPENFGGLDGLGAWKGVKHAKMGTGGQFSRLYKLKENS